MIVGESGWWPWLVCKTDASGSIPPTISVMAREVDGRPIVS